LYWNLFLFFIIFPFFRSASSTFPSSAQWVTWTFFPAA
jgi:hypothetical protein